MPVASLMTAETYWDLLVKTSREGGFPSFDRIDDGIEDDTKCVYRRNDGRKCPFGLLLQDNEYEPDFEEMSIAEILDYLGGEPDCMVANASLLFLIEVQCCHDALALALHPVWPHDRFVAALRKSYQRFDQPEGTEQ